MNRNVAHVVRKDDLGPDFALEMSLAGQVWNAARTMVFRPWHSATRVALSPVCVSPVVDVEDDHLLLGLVYAIADPVLPPTRTPQASEWRPQRISYLSGVRGQRPNDELPGGERGRRWERGCQCALSAGGKEDAVRGTVF